MDKADHIAKKHTLWFHIRELGLLYKEDEEFTKEYAKSVYEAHKDSNEDLDLAIDCFKELICQYGKLYPRKQASNEL